MHDLNKRKILKSHSQYNSEYRSKLYIILTIGLGKTNTV